MIKLKIGKKNKIILVKNFKFIALSKISLG